MLVATVIGSSTKVVPTFCQVHNLPFECAPNLVGHAGGNGRIIHHKARYTSTGAMKIVLLVYYKLMAVEDVNFETHQENEVEMISFESLIRKSPDFMKALGYIKQDEEEPAKKG